MGNDRSPGSQHTVCRFIRQVTLNLKQFKNIRYYAFPGYLQVFKKLNKNGESIFSDAQWQLTL